MTDDKNKKHIHSESCNHSHDGHAHSHSKGHSHDGHDHHEHGGHSHTPDLRHASEKTLKGFRVAFYLNLGFAFVELFGGYWTQSLAVMSDALHDFGDAFALGAALYLEKSSRAPSNSNYTYGFRRYSVLSALLTGVVLFLGSSFILYESFQRWQTPTQPMVGGMYILSLIGLSVNLYAALKMGGGHTLNEKMLRLHLLEDVFGWVLVLIGAFLIQITGWGQIDIILAMGLSCWVIYNVVRNLTATWKVFLQGVPSHISISKIEEEIKKHKFVKSVHHSHIWSIDGSEHIFTAHVIVAADVTFQKLSEIKSEIKKSLKQFDIVEATLEFETDGEECVDPHHH